MDVGREGMKSKINILLVEDDQTIAMGLSFSLQMEGYAVTTCHNIAAAESALAEAHFDLAILDRSLPDGKGPAIFQEIKRQKLDTAVIFLTVLGDEQQVVEGLDMGADDYIVKPFRLRELLSRIRMVLRRSRHTAHSPVSDTNDSRQSGEISGDSILRFGRLVIDEMRASVTKDDIELQLTALEYRLLLLLAKHPSQLMSRSRLLDEIWDIGGDFVNNNTLSVYIKRLREKIEDDPAEPVYIETVRGLGYRMGRGNESVSE